MDHYNIIAKVFSDKTKQWHDVALDVILENGAMKVVGEQEVINDSLGD